MQQLDPGQALALMTGAIDDDDLASIDLTDPVSDSFLGRIAAYRRAVLDARDMAEALSEAQDLLATQLPPDRSLEAMLSEMDSIRRDMSAHLWTLAEADRQIAADAAFRPDSAVGALNRLREEREELRGDILRAMDRAQTAFMVRELGDEIRLSMDEAARQLRAASGGPVPYEIEVEVQRRLGIHDDPRALLVDAVLNGGAATTERGVERTALR